MEKHGERQQLSVAWSGGVGLDDVGGRSMDLLALW